MGLVLLQFLPLAVAAIAPTLLGLVILFLGAERGESKAWAFILGKYLASCLWAVLFLTVLGAAHFARKPTAATRPAILIIELVVGGLLIILALRIALGKDDPDAPPPKFMAILDKMGPVIIFGTNLLWSLFQIRFILLLLIGTTTIATAALPGVESFLTLVILTILMIWPLLIPVGAFLFMGEQRDLAMQTMRAWLERHQRPINAVILAAIGLMLMVRGTVVL